MQAQHYKFILWTVFSDIMPCSAGLLGRVLNLTKHCSFIWYRRVLAEYWLAYGLRIVLDCGRDGHIHIDKGPKSSKGKLRKQTAQLQIKQTVTFKTSLFISISVRNTIIPICYNGWLVYSRCSHLEHRASVKRFVSLQSLNVRQSVKLLGWVISL
jgi:hypothetical protein